MSLFLLFLLADAPPALRPAAAILADYAQAIGGENAWKKHKTMRLKREIEAKGMNIRGTEERWATSAGKLLTVTTLPGIGVIKQGSTGKVRWSDDPINGLRVLQGPEDEEVRIDSTWAADVKLARLYKAVRAVPPPEPPPAGKKQECVELIPRLGKPAVTCFDAESHLRVYQKGTHATPQGEVPYTARFDDWRPVDGVRVPHREEMTAGPMTLEARLVEIQFGPKVDAKLFIMPKAPGQASAKTK